MRLIDADAMLARLKEWNTSDSTDKALYNFTLHRILEQPIIEPEHKTGKWIYKNDLKQFFCSECGYPSLTYDDTYIYGMDLPNYCEDCGADMREGQDERYNKD